MTKIHYVACCKRVGSGQTVAQGDGHRSGTGGRGELVADGGDVVGNRMTGDAEHRGDLLVRAAIDQETKHVALTRGQRLGAGQSETRQGLVVLADSEDGEGSADGPSPRHGQPLL